LYQSIRSTRDILHERWRLRVMAEERGTLFMQINTKADEEEAQAITDITSSASVAPPVRNWIDGRPAHHRLLRG
jgi:hypothetical protein